MLKYEFKEGVKYQLGSDVVGEYKSDPQPCIMREEGGEIPIILLPSDIDIITIPVTQNHT